MRSAANALMSYFDVRRCMAQLFGPCSANIPPLSTGASDAAVQFTLPIASGMIGNQRLEHFGEPRGEPLGSDTLGSDAGALPYQEDFVGETLGIGQPGIAAQANQPFAERGFVLADDTPRRMFLVRQLDRRVGECTAALGLILLEVTGMTQPGQKLAFRITRMGSGDRIPGNVEFPREFNETRGDQRILRREVAIERHLVGTGRLSDGVNADGMDAAAIEQFTGGREDALARGRAGASRIGCWPCC
jgi:hypothetical protein